MELVSQISRAALQFWQYSLLYSTTQDLIDDLNTQLNYFETQFDITSAALHPGGRFSNLLRELHRKLGVRVVGFYGTIKDYDAHVKFTFLTGVRKFSQVSLFSGLNNLPDLTLDPDYSSLCGYTDNDIDTVLAPELEGLDREKIKTWYNGYNWLGEHVYNPYDVLNLFKKRTFQNYWFETGTPTFLVKLLLERQILSLSLDIKAG